jgi:hypothetical protein
VGRYETEKANESITDETLIRAEDQGACEGHWVLGGPREMLSAAGCWMLGEALGCCLPGWSCLRSIPEPKAFLGKGAEERTAVRGFLGAK